jgi:hypothetical protein
VIARQAAYSRQQHVQPPTRAQTILVILYSDAPTQP